MTTHITDRQRHTHAVDVAAERRRRRERTKLDDPGRPRPPFFLSFFLSFFLF